MRVNFLQRFLTANAAAEFLAAPEAGGVSVAVRRSDEDVALVVVVAKVVFSWQLDFSGESRRSAGKMIGGCEVFWGPLLD